MEELALLPGIAAAGAELEGLRSLCDRREVQMVKAALLQQVADQILLMHTLHHHDNASFVLVIAARQYGRTIPFDHSSTHRRRHGIARLQWIIDDDQVATKPGKGAID